MFVECRYISRMSDNIVFCCLTDFQWHKINIKLKFIILYSIRIKIYFEHSHLFFICFATYLFFACVVQWLNILNIKRVNDIKKKKNYHFCVVRKCLNFSWHSELVQCCCNSLCSLAKPSVICASGTHIISAFVDSSDCTKKKLISRTVPNKKENEEFYLR